MKIFTDTSFLIIRPLLGKVFTLRVSATYCIVPCSVNLMLKILEALGIRELYNCVCN